MQLSKRVQALAESATLAVTARAKQLRGEGVDIVSFGAGEPDFDTPAHVRQACKDALDAGLTRYATPVAGVPPLRDAVCGKLKRENDLTYTPSHWLFYLLSSGLYELGGDAALSGLKIAMAALFAALLALAVRARGAGTAATVLLVVGVALLTRDRWIARPHLFSYVAFAFVLWRLVRAGAPARFDVAAIPLMLVVAINLHPADRYTHRTVLRRRAVAAPGERS